MEFHKWPKIENLETERLRNSRAFQKAWEIEGWVVSEKIDGTNIGLNIGPDGKWKLSSRNQFVDGNFYGIGSAWPQLLPLIELLTSSMIEEFDQFTLQGEFFGQKVMRRIDYRVPQAFRWFGAYSIHRDKGYERWPFSMVEHILSACGMSAQMVPILGRYKTFEQALTRATEQPSFFNPAALMEGVVIQPAAYPIEPDGLIFKWKRPDFKEVKLKKVHEDVQNDEIAKLNAEFKNYLTLNRMVGVFTKNGLPKGKADAGRYIGEFLNDAFGDFAKDKGCISLSAGELKAVKSAGSLPFNLFMEACLTQGLEI